MFDESDLRNMIGPELENDEELVWIGKPSLRRTMIPALTGFGIGVVWTAFIVNFIYMWHSGPNDVRGPGGLFGMQGLLADLFFLPFIFIGVAALFSPLWFYVEAKRTVYGLTNKRVLIVRVGRSRKVQTFGPDDIGDVERIERPDGSGDLSFARRHYHDSDGNSKSRATQLVGIPEVRVRSVEKLLRELARIG